MNFDLLGKTMKRREFIYNVGMAGMSLPFLNPAAAVGSSNVPKAKSVIYIFLSGGLSQYDSFNVQNPN